MNQRYFTLAAVLFACLFAGSLRADTTVPLSRVEGIYLTVHVDLPLDARNYRAALAKPFVDGAYLHASWDRVEPQPGKFDWSYFDSQIAIIAAQHKVVSLSVRAGASAPQWLYKAGAQTFHTVVGLKRRREFCSQIQLPVPWDAVFLKEWTNLVRAFGAHYANNPNVVLIKITGINYRTDETNLPHLEGGVVDSSVTNTSCRLQDDVAAWKSIGYTSAKVEAAFERIATAFGTAFPHQFLSIMTSERAFPPLGDRGQPDENARALSTTQFFAFGRRVFGQRLMAQNNGLSELKVESGIVAFGRTNPIGFQGSGPVTGGHHCRGERHQARANCGGTTEMQNLLDNALRVHSRFLELFVPDLVNPQFADMLMRAHRQLHAQ